MGIWYQGSDNKEYVSSIDVLQLGPSLVSGMRSDATFPGMSKAPFEYNFLPPTAKRTYRHGSCLRVDNFWHADLYAHRLLQLNMALQMPTFAFKRGTHFSPYLSPHPSRVV
ncbi:hypothetical protein EVAR_72399_1 [Eumeta japonica]|uniref:Uncharacterized protein n=1 Tax=Eumeta variegata TaxID=151549 RepID=A0A4C1THN7_EUMVA|nr:hypothetical protein EVAR_72399_1 [Eumeta japonica]